MNEIHIKNGEFEIRTPESQGIPSKAISDCLDAIIASGENVHSLYVFKGGYQIAGGCAKPFNPLSPRRVYSTMKSVIVIAILFLIQEGKLDFEDHLVDYFPEDVPEDVSEEMKNLTIRNILTMSVGQTKDALSIFHTSNYGAGMIPFTQRGIVNDLDFDPHGMTLEQIFFKLPMDYKPGTKFHYINTVPELLIRLVTKAGGTDLIHYLKPRLFDHLKTDVYNCQETWMKDWSPEGPARAQLDPVIGYLDGATTVTSTKDLCKFALFLMQGGIWEGKQLLDPALIREATSLQLPTRDYARLRPNNNETEEYGYGMQIWRNQYGGFCMLGGSGQQAVVIPELELIMVYNSMNAHLAERGTVMPLLIRDHIFKAARVNPMEENEADYREMLDKFAAWSTVPANRTASPASEEKYTQWFKASAACDGITEIRFDFAGHKAFIRQGENEVSVSYGTDGEFISNPKGPSQKVDGYSRVYGADPEEVKASGCWLGKDCFLLQLQYACDLIYYRYYCRFKEDGTAEIERES